VLTGSPECRKGLSWGWKKICILIYVVACIGNPSFIPLNFHIRLV
jgi:hypothetical protein